MRTADGSQKVKAEAGASTIEGLQKDDEGNSYLDLGKLRRVTVGAFKKKVNVRRQRCGSDVRRRSTSESTTRIRKRARRSQARKASL